MPSIVLHWDPEKQGKTKERERESARCADEYAVVWFVFIYWYIIIREIYKVYSMILQVDNENDSCSILMHKAC